MGIVEDILKNKIIANIVHFIPHAMVVLFGWKMTVGPGTLFFHKLKYFQIFQTPIFDAADLCTTKPEVDRSLKLSAFQIVRIPFVQDFFFELSLPCLYLFFLGSFYIGFKVFPEPDFYFLILCFVLLYISCFRAERTSFYYKPIYFGLISLIFPIFLQLFKIDLFTVLTQKQKYLIYGSAFLQWLALSITPVTNSINFYRYNHPKLEVINFSGFHSILRSLFSRFRNLLITTWHYIDIFIFIAFWLISNIYNIDRATVFLQVAIIVSTILSIHGAMTMIQFRMISLLTPLFSANKTEQPKLKHLIRPLGVCAFSTLALPVAQILINLALIQTELLHKGDSDSKAFLLILALNGELLLSSSILVDIPTSIRNGKKKLCWE